MYLQEAIFLNSGPIERAKFTAQFTPDGLPKPLILAGTNGSGKTGILSTVADAIMEIAATHYSDILPNRGAGHAYFKLIGGRNIKVGRQFEFDGLKFTHQSNDYYVRIKAGSVTRDSIKEDLKGFTPIENFDEQGIEKIVVGDTKSIETIFRSGAYLFFPSSRYELPHWANLKALDRDPNFDFSIRLSDKLNKPIVVQSGLQSLKPWIIDVFLDRAIDATLVLNAQNLDELKQQVAEAHFPRLINSLNINTILSNILGQNVRIARSLDPSPEKRICIASGNDLILPTLDHLSAGQSMLLSIFGTIARYGNAPQKALDQIEGIAVIDEVDSHLHASLQHDGLPALIKLFPKVQFILSSHAPLFLLGMKKTFGENGFSLIDMPTGVTIDTERFSEFENSFKYFQSTKAFEESVKARIEEGPQPLVLCEGETDPRYMLAAANLLGFQDVADHVEFDWVGSPTIQGAQGGGKSHLDDALKFLRNNPQFQNRSIVLLYDPETNKKAEDFGRVHIRTLPTNGDSPVRKSGIEHLLPAEVFEARFFEERIISGDDGGSRRVLKKKELCGFLCNERRVAADFEKFRSTLEEIRRLLLTP